MLAALAAAGSARAYSWPIAPFDSPHPVRGGFDDPRFVDAWLSGGRRGAYHSGVDIAAADGTPVHAVESGVVVFETSRRAAVSSATTEFTYWHIVPSVSPGAWVPLHGVAGRIAPGYGHVHLGEIRGTYVDPLRPGALEPYPDTQPPVVGPVHAFASGTDADEPLDAVHGMIDLAVEAYDAPLVAPPAPWNESRLTPSLVAWRLDAARGDVVLRERVVYDTGGVLQWRPLAGVYAPPTHQNDPPYPARYDFWLRRGFRTDSLPDGTYELWVRAADSRGNEIEQTFELVLRNERGAR